MKAIRISARHLGRLGLLGIALAAATVVFAAAFVVRILIGPISLGPFTGDLRASLNKTLPGLAVRFDDAALEWSQDEGRLNLVIMGARVFDENQRIIAQAPEAEIGLALGPFLRGHVVVHRIALVGVQLTLVHSKDGVLRLGVEGGSNQSDVLQRIRDAIAKSGNGASSLDSFAVHKARLAFYEEETGAFVVAPQADLQVTRGNGFEGAPKGTIKASVDAHVEISGKPAHVEAELTLPPTGNDLDGDVSISGLTVHSLAENSKFFSFLAPFDLVADMSGSFKFVHGTQVRSAEFGIGASGTINGLGKPLHVRSFKLSARYDGATGRLLIDDGSLEGVQARAHLTGQGDLSFDPKGGMTKAALDLQFDKVAMNMPGVMGRSVSVARAAIRGSYVPSSGLIAIDQAFVFGGQLSAKFAGRVLLANNQSPEIDLDGNIAPIAVRDLLRYWPLQTSPGARAWIDANVPAGRLGPIVLHTHMLPGALDQPALPDNAVSMSFPVIDSTIIYIHGLTPMTRINGSGLLTGDTFKADVTSGVIGPLLVSGAHAIVPNLHQRGTVGVISAHVEGSVADVLALADQKPLQYPTRFNIRTASARGTAAIDVTTKVPMLRDLKVDDIGIQIRAQTSNLGLALNDHLAISNGSVNFVVDNTTLTAIGNVGLGSTNLAIDWNELFKPKGALSTRVRISGTLPEAAREELGVHAGEYLTGPVNVSGELDGLRGNIQRGQLKLDLTPAFVSIGMMGYQKPVGVPAQAQLALRLDSNGTVRNADVMLTGPALASHATMRFAASGDLQALDVPYFRSGANDDFMLSLTHDPVQGYTVSSSGRSFDAEEMLRASEQIATQPVPKAQSAPEIYRINSRMDRVVMREGVVLAPFSLNVSSLGNRPRTLTLAATQSKTAQISGSITSGEDGGHIKLTAGDAGLLLKGLFGSTSLRGGTISVDAVPVNAPAKGDAASYSGTLEINEFTVVNQPFLTQLFSAGSFDGLAALMGGKGIVIDKLTVPCTWQGGVLSVHDARAIGSSLGLTGDGYYDLQTNQIGLQGAFTPLFGINGMLGSIPVLGSVFGSKKGEGLIGVTYSASGNADDPKVSVNPLSVLAPGILRRIFQGRVPSAPPVQATTNPPVPTPKPQ